MPAQIGSIEAQIDADSSGFTSGVGAATDALSGLVGKLGKGKAAMAGLAAGAAAAAAGGLAAATKQAAQFQRTIAGAAARAGATQRAMTEFGSAAKTASLESAFGANEAGGALRFLAKSGFEVQQATKALPGILKGATAAGMEAAEMGEIASNALRSFGRSTGATTEVMDVLVAASTNANTSVQELGQGISIVGGLANKAGMDIQSTAAVMAKLQDAGISASRAATAMRAGISRLLKPTGDAKTALESLGVSAKNSQGNFRGLIPVLTDLQEAGASSSQMLAIFGRRAGPTLQTALAQGGSSLQQFQKQMNNAGGTTKEVASFIRDSATEQLKVLGGTIKTLAIEIGELLLPALQGITAVMQGVTKFTSTMVGVFKSSGDALRGFKLEEEKTAEGAKKLGQNVDQAATKTEGMGASARSAAVGLREQERAQKAVNRSVKEFMNLSVKDQRKGIDALAKSSENLEKQTDALRKKRERLRAEFAAGDAGAGAELGEVNEKIQQNLKRREDLNQKIMESADAHSELTDDEEQSLKLLRLQEKVLRAQNPVAKARARFEKRKLEIQQSQTSQQVKQQRIENARLRMNKRITKEKQKQSKAEGGEQEGGPDFTGGFSPEESRTREAKQKTKARQRVKKAKRTRNFAKASRQWAKHSAKAKENTQEAKKAQQGLTQQQRRTVDATIGLVKTTGQAARNLMRATGASQQTSNVMGAAIKGAAGFASAMAAAAAASWSTATAISVATAGISAVTGTIAAAASAAGEDPGSQNISTGGTTSAGGGRRSQRNFADMLAKRIADEQEKRDIFRQQITIAGRSPGRRGRNDQPIDRLRETSDRLEEVEALEGV